MRTVVFKSVFEAILRRLGQDPLGDALTSNAVRAIVSHINDRVRYAWRVWDWPELEVLEERAFRTTWTSALNFNVGDEFYYAVDGNYYVCILAAPAGTLPTNATYFTLEGDVVDKYIAFDQVNQTPIGEVMMIYRGNPRTLRYTRLIDFHVSTKGIDVRHAPKTVWVRFRLIPSQFTVMPWVPGKVYNQGDTVYDADPVTGGDVYQSLYDGNTNPVGSFFPGPVVTLTNVVGFGVVPLTYVVVANFSNGSYTVSEPVTDPFGHPTNIATETINWNDVGATNYDVYRTFVGPGGNPTSTGKITSGVAATTATDFGQAGDGTSPPPGQTVWQLVPFPQIFSSYTKAAVFADCLRESDEWAVPDLDVRVAQARLARSTAADQEANDYLVQEMDNLTVQGQQNRYRGFGYRSRAQHDYYPVTIPNPA